MRPDRRSPASVSTARRIRRKIDLVAALRIRERHVARRLAVPRVAAAHERALLVGETAAVVAEPIARVEVSVRGESARVERVPAHRLLTRERTPVLRREGVVRRYAEDPRQGCHLPHLLRRLLEEDHAAAGATAVAGAGERRAEGRAEGRAIVGRHRAWRARTRRRDSPCPRPEEPASEPSRTSDRSTGPHRRRRRPAQAGSRIRAEATAVPGHRDAARRPPGQSSRARRRGRASAGALSWRPDRSPATPACQAVAGALVSRARFGKQGRMPIRVLTLNCWNVSEPFAPRVSLVRAEIERLRPDLVGL